MGTKLEEAFDMRPIKEAEANAEGEEIEDHDPDEDKEAAKNAVHLRKQWNTRLR